MSVDEREESAGATMQPANPMPGRFHPATYHLELNEHDAVRYEGTMDRGDLTIHPSHEDVDTLDEYISTWITAAPGSYLTRKDLEGGLPPYDDPSDTLLAIEVEYQDGPAYQIQEQGGSPKIIAEADALDDLGDWR